MEGDSSQARTGPGEGGRGDWCTLGSPEVPQTAARAIGCVVECWVVECWVGDGLCWVVMLGVVGGVELGGVVGCWGLTPRAAKMAFDKHYNEKNVGNIFKSPRGLQQSKKLLS